MALGAAEVPKERTLGLPVYFLRFNSDNDLIAIDANGRVLRWSYEHDRVQFDQILASPLIAVGLDRSRRLVAAAGIRGDVRVWDTKSRVLLRDCQAREQVWGIAVAPQAKVLATYHKDNAIRLWADDGVRLVGAHSAEVQGFALSPDDRTVASIDKTGLVRLWDVEHGEQVILRAPGSSLEAVSFSPDGREVAVGNGLGDLYRFSVPEPVVKRTTFAENISWIVGSHKGSAVFAASWGDLNDGYIRRWDVGTNHLEVGPSGARALWLDVLPDDNRIVAFNRDAVSVWDVKSSPWQEHVLLSPEERYLQTRSLSRDGETYAIASRDGHVHVWRTSDYRELLNKDFGQPVTNARLVLSGGGLAMFDAQGGVRLVDVSSGTVVWTHRVDISGRIDSIEVLANDKSAISGGRDGTLALWLFDAKERRVLLQHSGAIVQLRVRGSNVFFADDSGVVFVMDMETKRPHRIGAIGADRDPVSYFDVSPDGRHLGTTGLQNALRLWDLRTLDMRVLGQHSAAIPGIVFLADGSIATRSVDRTMAVWDPKNLKHIPSADEALSEAWLRSTTSTVVVAHGFAKTRHGTATNANHGE